VGGRQEEKRLRVVCLQWVKVLEKKKKTGKKEKSGVGGGCIYAEAVTQQFLCRGGGGREKVR